MNILKKGLSAALSAALIASLVATGAFATIGAAGTDSDQTDHLACLNAAVATVVTCSQVADGISTVTLSGDATGDAAGKSLYISASGATIISAAGDFVLGGGIVTDADPIDLTAADTITLRAPAAAGSAVVSVYEITTATGIAALEGTLTITFTATSGLAVSEANSTVKFVASTDLCSGTALTSNAADKATNPAAKLCVILKDGNGSAVTTGATVAVTITPVGLVIAALSDGTDALAGTAQVASTAVNTVAGSYAFGIGGSGLAGIATIGISVTQGTTTTTFAPKTFTFSGSLASLTVTQVKYALVSGAAAPAAYVIATVVGKDAAGIAVACDTAWTATSGTTTVIANANLDVVPATDCEVQIITTPTLATAGTTAITVKNAAGTIAAAPFNFSVSGDVATVTVAFSAASIAPGGSATLTMTAKDSGGRPVPDAVSPGTPLVSSGAATAWSTIRNGVATATYLAPFNTGVVTALGSVTTALPVGATVTGTGSANIGAVVPVEFTFNVTGTALGNTLTGPFTPESKISTGGYITWRFDGGAAAAGKTIEIWAYKKVGLFTNPWSAPYLLTTRVANASGVAFANITSGSVIWLSIRPVLAATATDAAVWGPWSIGRWIH